MPFDTVINTGNYQDQMHKVVDEVDRITDAGGVAYITVSEKKPKRSLSANAVQHLWYKAISDHTGDKVEDVEADCKLRFGLPIALADPDNGIKIDWTLNKIGFYEMHYERQREVMKLLAITRFFTSQQHTAYRDAMQVHWNAEGVHIDYKVKR